MNKRIAAVGAAVIAAIALTACESEAIITVGPTGDAVTVTSRTELPKQTVALMGVSNADELEETLLKEANGNIPEGGSLEVIEEGDMYVVSATLANPTEDQIAEALSVDDANAAATETWTYDGAMDTSEMVNVTIARSVAAAPTDASQNIDMDLGLKASRYVTLVMPNDIASVTVNPPAGTGQVTETDKRTVRVEIADDFQSLTVKSETTEKESNIILWGMAFLGLLLLVCAAGWYLTLRKKDEDKAASDTPEEPHTQP